MKIQINSLAALERLLNGDSQIEFDVRQSVAAAFAKKWLGATINQTTREIVDAKIKEEMQLLVFKPKNRHYEAWELRNEVKDLIAKEISSDIKKVINDTVTELLSDKPQIIANAESKINSTMKVVIDAINSAADKIEYQLTDKNIEDRINAKADKKIKEKLGI